MNTERGGATSSGLYFVDKMVCSIFMNSILRQGNIHWHQQNNIELGNTSNSKYFKFETWMVSCSIFLKDHKFR